MTKAAVVQGINNFTKDSVYNGSALPLVNSTSYKKLVDGTLFKNENAPGKVTYNYVIRHGETHFYFEYGIAPLCIFCAAVFSVFWGTLAGLLVKKVNMEDLTDVQKCCDEHGKNAEEAAALGLEKQASAPEVMEVLKLVGEKITEVSFLKSIIKHGLSCRIYNTCFFKQKPNSLFSFRVPKLSSTRNASGSQSGPALSLLSSVLPSISSK